MPKKSTTKKQKRKYTRKQKNIIQYVPINSGGMQTQGHPINSNIQWLPNNIPTQSDNTDTSRIISELMSKIEGPRQTQTQNVYINSNDIKQQQDEQKDNSSNIIKNISQNMEPQSQTPGEIIAEGTLSSAIGGGLAIGGVAGATYTYQKIKNKGGIRGTLLSVGETLYNGIKNTGNKLGGRSSKNRLVEETEPLLEPGVKFEKTKLKQNKKGYSQIDDEVEEIYTPTTTPYDPKLIDKRFSKKSASVVPKQLKFSPTSEMIQLRPGPPLKLDTPLKTVSNLTGLRFTSIAKDAAESGAERLKELEAKKFVASDLAITAKNRTGLLLRTQPKQLLLKLPSSKTPKKLEVGSDLAPRTGSIYKRKSENRSITRSQTVQDRRTIEPVRTSINPPTPRPLYASDHPDYRRGQRARNSNNPLPENASPEFMSGYNSKEQAKRGRPPKK